MKNIFKKIIYSLVLLSTIFVTSCTELDNSGLSGSYNTPVINSISTLAKDSITNVGNLYNSYILRGQNLASLNALYINDYKNDFNSTQVTDGVLFFTVSPNVPWKDVSSKLKIETLGGVAEVDFKIIQPAPVIKDFSPKLGPAGTIVTITGDIFDNLDSVFFGETEVTNIISSNEEEIVIEVPAGVSVSTLTVNTEGGSSESADFYGGIIYTIYDEGLNTSAWWEGSWGGATDLQSTENPFRGTYSIRKEAGAWSALQVGTWTTVNVADYILIQFEFYSEAAGTINIVLNGDWGNPYPINVIGGEWQTISAPLSDVSKGKEKIEAIVIQEASGNNTVHYIDDFGFI
ncbi:IPT/TIG domain-containing protein [Thalassobellus citreus]|uniref:IPT/TIG domain-containing protein n=1 Tax=Thalassobellus citreus TaxID=3367752 RepID=UPI0037A095BD